MSFTGAKLAVFIGDKLLVIRRDMKTDIPFPDHWDLPGGGRDFGETPEDCVLRETFEEVGLALLSSDLIWSRRYGESWFFVSLLPPAAERQIKFGDEGQYWSLMSPQTYLNDPMAIPIFAERLKDYLCEAARIPQKENPPQQGGGKGNKPQEETICWGVSHHPDSPKTPYLDRF